MRVAVVNLTGGGLSGGYRKYLEVLVPLLCEDPRVTALEVYGRDVTPREVSQFSPDVIFIPTARWASFGRPPVVPMVRNMEPLTVPFAGNPPSEAVKNLMRARLAKRACRRGDRIIAVSGHVRDFLVRSWGIDAHKVGVVEHGVEAPLPKPETVRPAALDRVAPGFVFTAGSLRPARGLEDVIVALGALHRRGMAATLVVAGSADPQTKAYATRIRRLSAECGVEDDVLWAGQLSRREMSWCYHHCHSFVMTSRAEACPNVLLEAMAHGCLCISAATPPMTEMLGDRGLFYIPRDASDLTEKLTSALSMRDAVRRQRVRLTLEAVTRFDWRRTAEETVTQLELAVGRR
jgi:glycosyltransferase involved in cell wall biosynthesis